MKVLMLNGSPKARGNTALALEEIGRQLNEEGIEYEIFQIGGTPVRDCIGCGQCNEHCPQRIDIPKEMQRINNYVEALKRGIDRGLEA